MFETGFD